MAQLGHGLVITGLVFGISSAAMSMGTMSDPGPAWFPFWLSMILIGLGAWCLVRPVFHDQPPWPWHTVIRTTGAVLCMSASPVMGLWLCSFGTVMIMRDDAMQRRSIAVAAISASVITVLLTQLLQVALPVWP